MQETRKPIRLSGHAKQQLGFRCASEQDVVDTVRTSEWEKAGLERLECRKNFSFNGEWNGKFNATRQVRPIFLQEPFEIVVVTVYVYYF